MKTKGFTLLELMVIVAITGVLLTLAAPSFIDLIRSTRLTTVTNQIIGGLTLARSEAIKRNTDIHVKINESGYPLVILPANCNSQNCWLKALEPFPPDYHINFYPATTAITYHDNGTLEQPGYLQLCTPDRVKVIILQFTGHLQIAQDRDHNGLPEVFNPDHSAFEDVAPCQSP